MKRSMIGGSVATVLMLAAMVAAQAGDKAPAAKDVQAVRDKAIAYLKTAQNKDGSFAPQLGGPGVTALVVAGLLKNGVSDKEPMVAKALEGSTSTTPLCRSTRATPAALTCAAPSLKRPPQATSNFVPDTGTSAPTGDGTSTRLTESALLNTSGAYFTTTSIA